MGSRVLGRDPGRMVILKISPQKRKLKPQYGGDHMSAKKAKALL